TIQRPVVPPPSGNHARSPGALVAQVSLNLRARRLGVRRGFVVVVGALAPTTAGHTSSSGNTDLEDDDGPGGQQNDDDGAGHGACLTDCYSSEPQTCRIDGRRRCRSPGGTIAYAARSSRA